MDLFIWIGSALGGVLGLLHGVRLYRQKVAYAGGGRAAGLYYGLWAFVLWTVFGAYVLAFWILGSIGYALARLMPRRRTA
jgi:hypothetical protein